MKVTKEELKQIIKEEIASVIKEIAPPSASHTLFVSIENKDGSKAPMGPLSINLDDRDLSCVKTMEALKNLESEGFYLKYSDYELLDSLEACADDEQREAAEAMPSGQGELERHYGVQGQF
jgi:hypothetical protein